MANAAIATPTMLFDPGFLYWAPIGSTMPANTGAASVFSDTWPVAWIPLGMTDTGTEFDRSLTVSPVTAAESIDPIAYRTVDRVGSVIFMLKSFTATNLARTFNGASTTVTGSGATTVTRVTPPAPGAEVRCMIGYESLDSTYRFVAYQVINSGSVKTTFAKAPANTSIPWTGMLEKPLTTQPWDEWLAGVARS